MKKYFFAFSVALLALVVFFAAGTVSAYTPPTIVNMPIGPVSPTSAIVIANIAALGSAPSVVTGFQYGHTTAYGSTIGSGTPAQPQHLGEFSAGPGGLCSTIHYRAYARDSATGTYTYSADRTVTVTTLCPIVPPTVQMVTATYAGSTATITGKLLTLGSGTSGIPPASLATAVSFTQAGSPITATPASVTTAGSTFSATYPVTCGHTYAFFAKANNTNGSATSPSSLSVTTAPCPVPTAPTVVTNGATLMTMTSAKLSGTMTAAGTTTAGLPGGPTTTQGFDYKLSSAGSFTTVTVPGSFAVGTPFTYTFPSGTLTCGQAYQYKAHATNSAGTGTGALVPFSTLACAPPPPPTPWLVWTDPASAIGAGSATFNGNISVVGTVPLTTIGFNYKVDGTVTTATGADPYVSAPYTASTFGIHVTGLPCMTTVHFRAWVQDTAGTRYYATTAPYDDRTVVTASCATPPTVMMQSITGTTITGKLFSLGTNASGTIISPLSTNVGFTVDGTPVSAGIKTLAGDIFTAPYVMPCAATHNVYATGNNTNGTAAPAGPMAYSNPCALVPPVVNTLTATVAGTTVVLNGHLVSYGVGPGSVPATSATVAFNFGGTPTASTTSPLFGFVDFHSAPFTVACGTGTYTYYATATSTGGTGAGASVTFAKPACVTPPGPLTVVTDAATSITMTSAVLHGHVTSLGTGYTIGSTPVESQFNYMLDSVFVPGGGYSDSIPVGTTTPIALPYNFSGTVSGLTCNTTYDFDAAADTPGFIREGANMSFTTLPCSPPIPAVPPTVTTNPATSVIFGGATLNGTLNTIGTLAVSGAPAGSTNLSFEYGTTAGGPYTSPVAGVPSVTSAAPTAFSTNVTGLTDCVRYYYRAKAVNAAGTAYGAEQSFFPECPATPPTVQTIDPTTVPSAATPVTATTATIHGRLLTIGISSGGMPVPGPTTLGFSYGPSATAGSSWVGWTGAPTLSIVSAGSPPYYATTAPTDFSATITGLVCATAYKFEATASNAAGPAEGLLSQIFTTLPCTAPPVVTTTSAGMTGSTYTFTGQITDFGAGSTSANVGFEYGPTTAYTYGYVAATSPGPTITTLLPTPPFFTRTIPVSSLPAIPCSTTSIGGGFWHMRAKATNSGGIVAYGADKTFCQAAP